MKKLFGLVLVAISLGAFAGDNFNILDNTQATISGGSISGISPPIPVASGGTGAATLTGIVKGNGTSAMTAVTAPTGALVGTTDTQSLSGKTFDTLSASSTTAGILVNRTSGNTVNSILQYGGTDYIGYGYDGTDNFLWGYSANDVKLGARGSEKLRLTTTGATVTGSLNVTSAITGAGISSDSVGTYIGDGVASAYLAMKRVSAVGYIDFKDGATITHRLISAGGNFQFVDVDGSTVRLQYNSSGIQVTGTIQAQGGSTNKATCWKSSGVLGYCSSIVGADGSCTCN